MITGRLNDLARPCRAGAITDAIDTHVQGQKHDDDESGTGSRGLIARKIGNDLGTIKAQVQDHALSWAFVVERVTGIEPALSAWE